MIVDDDEVLAEIVTDLLEQAGHMVSAVYHGDEAIDAALASAPDLIILDYALPGRSGMDVLRTLRNTPALADVPIMMLTGKRGNLLPARAEHDGVDDYINKPFNPEELATRVEVLLRRASTVRGRPR
ncbi:response regulator [Sphingomonas sp. GC_Shp_5]|uniref:response regulator transcription factor n=1 Tax=Sphingomonas sp. GC_Shp_5 TaxID=2937379 RepID=UPI00226A1C5A|nr:response regulator [Sphingomonas sp. GC_Shp_5]